MQINGYIIGAIVAMALVLAAYAFNFFFYLDYGLSEDANDWAGFGGYVGGVLSPILSFVSIVLLIKSLNIQNVANQKLSDELSFSKKTEKLKTFETLFFNIVNSQKNLFDSFRISNAEGGEGYLQGVAAVQWLEDEIEERLAQSVTAEEIKDYIEHLDIDEKIFGIVRAFYLCVKLITERLNDENDFSYGDRRSYFQTLINLTDFAQLRLIMIGAEFLKYPSTDYLKSNEEFVSVFGEVGLSFNKYSSF